MSAEKTPLVSVVLPVHNAGHAIASAFDQLDRLDYPNLEFIFIDDASSDDTAALLAAYVDRESRAELVTLANNRGPAGARNLGLSRARGQYVWFVDWDDAWRPMILREMVHAAERASAEIVVCGASWRSSAGRDFGRTDGLSRDAVYSGKQCVDLILMGRIEGYLWNKLFRRSLLGDSPFPDMRTQEDLCAVAHVLPRAERVAFIGEILYHHVVRAGSVTNTRNPPLDNLRVAYRVVRDIALTSDMHPARERLLRYWRLRHYLSLVGTSLRLSDDETSARFLREFRESVRLRDIFESTLISPRRAAKAGLVWMLGDYYVPLRVGVVRVRNSWRSRPPQAGGGVDIVIRTLPLRRGNYGGILQAYSLQKALESLGYVAAVDVSERLPAQVAMKKALMRGVSRLVRRPVGFDEKMRQLNWNINSFVETKMRTVRLFVLNAWLPPRRLSRLSAVVVGSDQVWRPQYGDVNSYLLDFVPANSRVRRIAYAASFGTDKAPRMGARSADFVRRFDAVSVREETGVDIARDLWGVEASRMPDPTFLVDPAMLAALGGPPRVDDSVGGAFAYVLDESPSMKALLASLPEAMGTGLVTLAVPTVGGSRGFELRPKVEDWVRSIRDADAVITDSFHGTVFALLFKKQFVAVGNVERGMSRFEALLARFGLTQRLVMAADGDCDKGADHAARVTEMLRRPIDWDLVTAVTQEERARGLDFLSMALSRGVESETPVSVRVDPQSVAANRNASQFEFSRRTSEGAELS
ncbi:polysaccharide pyruvyl transferase family protein [Microbacterium trichothecenolyticum]|uniref:polysaccharide pyruvyl transferase family protein n=1 Tax=Microbacterium trichothecenolyticum TaxID=69370 RepID=UPI001C6DF04A|nr:polysaccharide pyruvyl transferase family protein [Microbacterium trichothecenolyticum]